MTARGFLKDTLKGCGLIQILPDQVVLSKKMQVHYFFE